MARPAALSATAVAAARWPGPAVEHPPAMLATLLVIGGECMLFAGLVFVFWVLRAAAPVWPPPLQPRMPLGAAAAATVVLLGSSATLAKALGARRRRDAAGLVGGLDATAALGGLFLAVQGMEWMRLLGSGFTVTSGVYGALFYTLVGAHALHVLAAEAWLGASLVLARRGRFAERPAPLQACALYWHFVVALWPILLVSVYLA